MAICYTVWCECLVDGYESLWAVFTDAKKAEAICDRLNKGARGYHYRYEVTSLNPEE